jgi:predicted GNAT family acetyltransferase
MQDHSDKQQFERIEQGALVYARYRRDGDRLIIRHVEADPVLRGTGAADRLMRDIADHARSENLLIVPLCGYASAWLRRHAREMIANPSAP